MEVVPTGGPWSSGTVAMVAVVEAWSRTAYVSSSRISRYEGWSREDGVGERLSAEDPSLKRWTKESGLEGVGRQLDT